MVDEICFRRERKREREISFVFRKIIFLINHVIK